VIAGPGTVVILGGRIATDPVTIFFASNVVINGDTAIDAGTSDVAFDGTLTVNNATATITAANVFLGPDTTLNQGVIATGGNVQVIGTLEGVGTVTGPTSVLAGGTVAPGLGGAPGELTFGDGITFAAGSSLDVTIAPVAGAPTAAGLTVLAGSAVLNGANLGVTVAGFTPTPDETFTIIQDDAAAVTGTFAEGSVVVSGGVAFTFPVSYNLGGFDVVLGGLAATPPAPPAPTPTPPAPPTPPVAPPPPLAAPPTTLSADVPDVAAVVAVVAAEAAAAAASAAGSAVAAAAPLTPFADLLAARGDFTDLLPLGSAAGTPAGTDEPGAFVAFVAPSAVDLTALAGGTNLGADAGQGQQPGRDPPVLQPAPEPLRVYLDTSGSRAAPRDTLDASILGLTPGTPSRDDGPPRLHAVEEAGYLLNSSLNQADDNALNVERLLRRGRQAAPPKPGPQEETAAPAWPRRLGGLGWRLWAAAVGVLGVTGLALGPRRGRRDSKDGQRGPNRR